MNDAELRSFCNEMIGKFKMLSDLQREMQYELIDTKFTEWELKKLIFALDVLRTIADRPQGEWIDCEEPPSTDRNVFIAYGTDDMKSVCIGHYEHGMKLWYEDKNFFAKPIYDAMYWCEIPQFPTWMKGADDEDNH